MKALLLILGLSLVTPSAFSCSEPTRRKVGSILHNLKSPTYWRTVKGTSFEGNKSHPAFVTVLKNIPKSYVEYKGDVYRFDEQKIVLCDRPRTNEIQAIHPDAKATIIRTGNGDEALLTIRSGFITMRLRPTHLVREPSSFEGEPLDLFQMLFKASEY